MGYHPLVCRRFKLIIFWNPHAGEATLKRIVHELALERYEADILAHLPGDPKIYWADRAALVGGGERIEEEDKDEFKDYRKLLVVRDPWSRFAHYMRDALIAKKTDFIIEKRHRMIDVRNTPAFELIRLLSVLNPAYYTDSLARQSDGLEGIRMDAVVPLDHLCTELPRVLREWGVPFAGTRCAQTLKDDMAKEEGETALMARAYVGKVRPSCLNHGALPPTNCFFDKDTWDLIADVYGPDLDAYPALRRENPF